METKFKWNEGEGYFTATYFDGSGFSPVSVTSDINEGLDRNQSITVETTYGDNPKKVSVSVKQNGLREKYITADGEVYITADNEIYGCLKG